MYVTDRNTRKTGSVHIQHSDLSDDLSTDIWPAPYCWEIVESRVLSEPKTNTESIKTRPARGTFSMTTVEDCEGDEEIKGPTMRRELELGSTRARLKHRYKNDVEGLGTAELSLRRL
jgi:hypothetical protein